MSLINKALKKEQQRRIGSPPDAALYALSSHSPARARHRHDNRNLSILIGFVCLGVFVLGLSGAFVYFGSQYIAGLNGDSEPTALVSAEASPTENKVEAAKAETPEVDVATSTDKSESAAVAAAAPIAETVSATPEAPLPSQVSEPVAVDQTPANSNSELVDPTEGINRNGDPEIWEFVDGLKIQGIRAAGPNSRLLLNGRVYKIGYTIDRKFGLKFKSADEFAVFFEDQQGRIYDKVL